MIWAVAWYAWFRDSPSEKAGVTAAERVEIGMQPPAGHEILAQQPNLCAVCLDTGRRNAGAVFGFMNTAANAASAVSSIAFRYMVGYFGNYDAPFIPMVAMLCVGTWLWLKVDPEQQLAEEEGPLSGRAAELVRDEIKVAPFVGPAH